jgi:hypothetical protein
MPFKNRWFTPEKSLTLAKAVLTPEVLARHAIQQQMVHTRQANIQQACLLKGVILEAAATLGVDPDAPLAACTFG